MAKAYVEICTVMRAPKLALEKHYTHLGVGFENKFEL